jgi:hypothetical protein
MIASAGYQAAFIRWGIIQGVTVIVAAFFLKSPPAGWLPGTWTPEQAGGEVKKRQTKVDFTSGQMAATPNDGGDRWLDGGGPAQPDGGRFQG